MVKRRFPILASIGSIHQKTEFGEMKAAVRVIDHQLLTAICDNDSTLNLNRAAARLKVMDPLK